jgi:hypothetical protein
MKISNDTSISMPIKNMLAIVAGVAMGVFAYTEVTSRLTSLETSRELFEHLKDKVRKNGNGAH